jgi:hypothetical protein
MVADMTKASAESVWLERVREWRQSEVSAARFCEDKPFHPASLLGWSSRLGREGKVSVQTGGRGRRRPPIETAGVEFARLLTYAPAQPSAALVVAVGLARIEVSPGFDAKLLCAVIEALKAGAQ